MTVTGREHFKSIRGPCIVVGNHTSHLDALVLFHSLPQRIKWNIYMGAAADRWFVTGRPELVMQPWYQSLVMGTFPIQRGGGSRALDYPKWLIKNGANLVIFPEGTRSTSRKMAKFQHGVSILATEMNVPVVPIYLVGLNKLRPKGSREITSGPAGAHFQPAIRLPRRHVGSGRDEDDLRRAELGARARAAVRRGRGSVELARLTLPVRPGHSLTIVLWRARRPLRRCATSPPWPSP